MNLEAREARIDKILAYKQPHFELFLDNIHDSHNLSAIIRSADAVGLLNLYYTNPENCCFKIHKNITQGAQHWVNRYRVEEKEKVRFLQEKKAAGYQVLVTYIAEETVVFRDIDYTIPTIMIMGNEKKGVSAELIALADSTIEIPMRGMVQSLNVSVATALILYEAQRQREDAGMYESAQLSQNDRDKIKKKWIYRDTVARRSKGKIAVL